MEFVTTKLVTLYLSTGIKKQFRLTRNPENASHITRVFDKLTRERKTIRVSENEIKLNSTDTVRRIKADGVPIQIVINDVKYYLIVCNGEKITLTQSKSYEELIEGLNKNAKVKPLPTDNIANIIANRFNKAIAIEIARARVAHHPKR